MLFFLTLLLVGLGSCQVRRTGQEGVIFKKYVKDLEANKTVLFKCYEHEDPWKPPMEKPVLSEKIFPLCKIGYYPVSNLTYYEGIPADHDLGQLALRMLVKSTKYRFGLPAPMTCIQTIMSLTERTVLLMECFCLGDACNNRYRVDNFFGEKGFLWFF